MRYEIKAIGIWAFVKVSFFVNLAFGFLFGIFFALIIVPLMAYSMRLSGLGSTYDDMPPIGALAVMLPFMFALTGAVFNTLLGVILVVLYNLLARLLGGLELDFSPVVELSPVLQPGGAQVMSHSVPASLAAAPAYPPPPPPPSPPAHIPPAVVATETAPPPEIRPETLEETPPAPIEPDEDGPRPDET